MKKIKLFLLILISSILFSSCALDISDNNRYRENLNRDNITINVNTVTYEKSSLEEAIASSKESVVVINAHGSSNPSSGSGVIIGKSEEYDYIVTCSHVVEGLSYFEVITSNGALYDASLVGADPISDLAVLQISKTNLKAATFVNDSHELVVGATTIAIGNPLGTLGGTVTKGIISSTSRSIKMSDGSVHNLLQTDAAINSGNSGGGLFNDNGDLIGIVSAKYSATGVEGLGFAIPSNQVQKIIQDLIKLGYVEGRTSLGVTFSDGYFRTSFFGSYYRVVYVSYIDPNGSSDNILKLDDIITKIEIRYNDATKQNAILDNISEAKEIDDFLDNANLSIDDVVVFTIKRGGYNSETSEISVVLKQYIYK